MKIALLLIGLILGGCATLDSAWDRTEYAEIEFQKINGSVLFIEKQKTFGLMSEQKAELHLDIQRNTSAIILLTLIGLDNEM